jgi:hypothetical protein
MVTFKEEFSPATHLDLVIEKGAMFGEVDNLPAPTVR